MLWISSQRAGIIELVEMGKDNVDGVNRPVAPFLIVFDDDGGEMDDILLVWLFFLLVKLSVLSSSSSISSFSLEVFNLLLLSIMFDNCFFVGEFEEWGE